MNLLLRQTPAGESVDFPTLAAPPPAGRSADPISEWQAFGSGTMALAAAMLFARDRTGGASRILMPAYSCPDIVAAAQFAGLAPEFLDLAPDRTSPAEDSIATAIRSGIRLALVVDLFGTASELGVIRRAANECGSWLIHDRAQCHAGPGEDVTGYEADLVVVSRGRGKPATLLQGGATWAKDAVGFSSFATTNFEMQPWHAGRAALRALAYDLALNPTAYGVIARLPFLRLGETKLRPLPVITRLPASWTGCAAEQLHRQTRHLEPRRQRTLLLCESATRAGLVIPADARQSAGILGLNRLPVICRDAEQARYLCTSGAALGVSEMYGRTLPEFLNHTPNEVAGTLPNAFRLSRTLVTLPTHSRMAGRPLKRLLELISDCR